MSLRRTGAALLWSAIRAAEARSPCCFPWRRTHEQGARRRRRSRHPAHGRGQPAIRAVRGDHGDGWRNGVCAPPERAARSDRARPHAAAHERSRVVPEAANGRRAGAGADADGAGPGGRSRPRPRPRRGRLRHEAVLRPGAHGARACTAAPGVRVAWRAGNACIRSGGNRLWQVHGAALRTAGRHDAQGIRPAQVPRLTRGHCRDARRDIEQGMGHGVVPDHQDGRQPYLEPPLEARNRSGAAGSHSDGSRSRVQVRARYGRMTRTGFAAGVLFTLAATIGLVAQSAQELYQRALVEEQANGNLTQAIALYVRAAQGAGKDRALAAKALMRMAGAHEKRGAEADAEKSYTELVRAYPEQRSEVTVAQQRLAVLRRARRVDAATPSAVTADRAPDTELAARLSALIWSGAPDATLLEAARRGDLHDSALLRRQIVRMLRDQKSNALVDDFFTRWLSLDKLKADRSRYPLVDDELLQALQTEARLFLQSQLRDDRDALELWTANYTFVNDRLAGHYGLSGISGRQFRRVTWPDANRAGILGQAGLLAVLSFPERTSPTLRGTFVLSRFLGMEAPAPPANVPALEERLGGQSGTLRDRMIAHRTHASCASCHVIFDPFGLALENFDAVGRWRTSDGGAPIDASGSFADGTRFSGPAELRAVLLKRRDAYYSNVTEQLLSYALNRKGRSGRVYAYEMPAVRKIVRDASDGGYRWSSILAGITASEPFQKKTIVP